MSKHPYFNPNSGRILPNYSLWISLLATLPSFWELLGAEGSS